MGWGGGEGARRTSFKRPIRMSVASVLSCASSRMMVEYRDSMLSFIASLKSIPSVMYFRKVELSVMSSNRIE